MGYREVLMVRERRVVLGLQAQVHAAAVALAVTAAVGCGRTVELTHVAALPQSSAQRAFARAHRFRTSLPAPVASIEVRPVRDARGDAAVGSGRDELLHVRYGVEADGDVGPWMESYVRSALVAERLSPTQGGAAAASGAPRGVLTVSLRRFHIDEATWARGVAVLDVRLVWSDGLVEADRLTAVTTELWADDGDQDWSLAAGRLAGWSAQRVATWTAAATARRTGDMPAPVAAESGVPR